MSVFAAEADHMDLMQATLAADDLTRSFEALEAYHTRVGPDLSTQLRDIARELQEQLGNKSRVEARDMQPDLRQLLFEFIQQQDLQQLQDTGTLLHEVPQVDTSWEYGLQPWDAFLLRPPQPNKAAAAAAPTPPPPAAAAAAAPAAAASRSRQRVANRDKAQGQQSRSFDSYGSRKAVPLSDAPDETRWLLSVAMPVVHNSHIVGSYRCWVCVVDAASSADPPATGNGHKWVKPTGGLRLRSSSKGAATDEGWVDVSVGLGVFEPSPDDTIRKRSRSLSTPLLSPQGSQPLQQQDADVALQAGFGQAVPAPHAAAAAAAMMFGAPATAAAAAGDTLVFDAPPPPAAAAVGQLAGWPLGINPAFAPQPQPMTLANPLAGVHDMQQQQDAGVCEMQQQQQNAGWYEMQQQRNAGVLLPAAQAAAISGPVTAVNTSLPPGFVPVTGPLAGVGAGAGTGLVGAGLGAGAGADVGFMQHQQQQQQSLQAGATFGGWLEPSGWATAGHAVQQQVQHIPQQQQQQQQAVPLGCSAAAAAVLSAAAAPAAPATTAAAAAEGHAAALQQAAAGSSPHMPDMPSADELSALLGHMLHLGNEQQERQAKRQLIDTCKAGGDLMECVLQLHPRHRATGGTSSSDGDGSSSGGGSGSSGGSSDGSSGSLQQHQVQAQELLLLQQEQQQALQWFVRLLLGSDVVDAADKRRNLLHLVATHSLGVSHERRLQQLELLLHTDTNLATKLMRGENSNRTNPLMVAASGIRSEQHAQVFKVLLEAADALVLAQKSKSGWALLHCLANEAAKAEAAAKEAAGAAAGAAGAGTGAAGTGAAAGATAGPAAGAASTGAGDAATVTALQRMQLLQRLMRVVVARVQAVAQQLAAPGTDTALRAAAMLLQQCLRGPEPKSIPYKGHAFMQQLRLELPEVMVAAC